ncbi:disks large-associated protein 5 isoform X2 [Periophthalmus magnuspinnatus]|uniref:disks large-associated protein 5 isoform X2 n=1 Tax=Periophthalmus magnuspinnatus TaxID=409849 RepID=UPI00243696B5|nr:disks large-associated protein 5 isoform X2 [Periophthalmus magnuspinnatus]
MASRFAHLRQRDNSVSMLRVKMSRRRSQSQKENRERIVNTRRQLEALQEMDMSALDASIAVTNMSVIQEKKKSETQLQKNVAGEERLKQLQRWKERKALEKEKEQREKSRKGVFKTGLYHPKDALRIGPLPPVPAAHGRAKETKIHATPAQSSRVTRSMKQQQQVQKPLNMQDVNAAGKKSQPPVERAARSRVAPNKAVPSLCKTKAEPVTRGLSTRSVNKPPVTAAPVMKDKPKDKCADVRTTRSKVVEVAPPPAEEKKCDVKTTVPEKNISKPEMEKEIPKQECSRPTLQTDEEEMVVDQTVPGPALDDEVPKSFPKVSSFAPEGFLFQVPNGLSSIKFEPLTPRSAEAFLTPSSSFTLPPAPTFNEQKPEKSEGSPPKSPHCSPLSGPTTIADAQEEEPKHDVPYFRSEIANETNRLTVLCTHWESKVEDEAIPEEMRDCMRTAVGQARLLMKERFKQFSGLVDDCDFCRGEKITTCTDLQGFWDMVYFQVEDVNKKFDALKEAEGRGWMEDHKPLPRQRKVVKKPAAAPAPSKPAGTKAAAKSRLAAAKAAMKARQQATESEKPESTEQTSQDTLPVAQRTDSDGDFFQVASPAKPQGSVRRSSRLSARVLPQPCPSSNCFTPRKVTRRSLALVQTPVQTRTMQEPMTTLTTPHSVTKTPAPVEQSLPGIPQPQSIVSVSLCFSPVKDVSSDPTEQSKDMVSDSTHSIPSIDGEEQKGLAEDLKSELIQTPQLPDTLCKSLVECAAPVPSVSLSFTLSPCTEQLGSQAVSCTPRAVQNLLHTQDFVAATPDSSVTEDIGVDFERYLQPSLRDSLSPRQPFPMESPMAMDVDLESPRGQPEESVTQQDADSGVSSSSVHPRPEGPDTAVCLPI